MKLKKNITLKIFILTILINISFFMIEINIIPNNKNYTNKDKTKKLTKINEISINQIESKEMNISNRKCHLLLENLNIRIMHLIITRFLIIFYGKYGFPNKLYRKDYITNGIKVMKKYLIPSLENQSCKNFTWILMLGNKANITYVKSLINFNNSFESKIIYQKDIKNYVKNITKGFDVLITTRIDYDDMIYYDAVNDVRKAVNINKPLLLYGYNRGIMYFESEFKSCDFYFPYGNVGVWSIFATLILVLNKVNDTYIVYDLGDHTQIRKTVLEKYKSYGINELKYEPAIFDSGDPKFAWVRQKYSGMYEKYGKTIKGLKLYDFNISKFYGK